MSEIIDKIDDAVAVIPAFDQEVGAWTCEYCGNDLYSACPTCAVKQLSALQAEATSLQAENERLRKGLNKIINTFGAHYNFDMDEMASDLKDFARQALGSLESSKLEVKSEW